MRHETSPPIPQSTDGLLKAVDASLPAPRTGMPRGMLREHWYVAAFGSEISREPVRRVLLDDPVVLYRKIDGGIVALYDRCAHRSYPLSRGTLRGDEIVCGYHGFVFDPCGTCVAVPGQDMIPKAARVRSYPVVESGPFVWIWTGKGEADPATIPDHHWACDPTWATFVNKALVNVRYGLLIDNLLDLSHETYIHAKTIGTPEIAQTPITTEVEGLTVKVSRKLIAAECPPFYEAATGIKGRIDRSQDITYHVPAFYVLHVRIARTGDTSDGFHVQIMYALTPETGTTTHDFWALSRNFAVDQAWVTQKMAQIQDAIVNEDVVALEALEQTLPLDGPVPEVSINIDRGGLQARRLLHNLLRLETPSTSSGSR